MIAASNYQVPGAHGPHPYLVGEPEGENERDMLRAACNLPAAHASSNFAV